MRTQEFYNKVADLCVIQFNRLPKTGKPKNAEWTVLSCIVKEDNSNFEVVALGTGSRCIGKLAMCPKGTILNDSHAEIICRRSFLRYLYDQMTYKDSIFTYNENSKKFSIKSNVDFHFFTSHVPCGDAAIFPKQDVENFGEVLTRNAEMISSVVIGNTKHNAIGEKQIKRNLNEETNSLVVQMDEYTVNPEKQIRLDQDFKDIFRTGAKCLENDVRQDPKESGAGYHILGVVRTKPGRGDPTMSVSCSDKIAKWCHLGIQGALLSFLLEKPIYFSTFTIAGGTPFNKEALERALFTRLEGIRLINPFKAVKLEIGQAQTTFACCKSEDKVPCSSSIAWIKIKNERPFEIAVGGRKQGVTKKNMYTKSAALKISKYGLFNRFCTIAKKSKMLPSENKSENLKYIEAKHLSEEYQQNWSILKQYFGVWIVKDSTFLQFCSDL